MAFDSRASSSALTLGSSYAVVQKDAADWEFEANPGELVNLEFSYNPQTTPTEYCSVKINASLDGTNWFTDGIVEFVINNDSDPNVQPYQVAGFQYYRFEGKVIDTDGTAGGDDTGSTLTVHAQGDGVSQ